jgi:hypothetical protein
LIIDEKTNPRENYGDLEQFARGLFDNGIDLPISCQKVRGEEKYKVKHGFRRSFACRWIWENLKRDMDIPVLPYVLPTGANERVEDVKIAVRYNDQLGLNPMELSKCINIMLEEGYNEEGVAKEFGKTQAWVNNTKRLKDIPEKAAVLVKHNKISGTEAVKMLKAGTLDDFITQVETGKIDNTDIFRPFDPNGMLDIGVGEKPPRIEISEATVSEADPGQKAAKITAKTLQKTGAKKATNSLVLLKSYVKKNAIEPNKKATKGKAEFIIFLLKLINNEATQQDIAEFFS